MNQTAKIARGLALILALLLVAAAAPAQLAKPDPHPGGIAWATDGEYASLELVVSGPEGVYLRQEFGPGENPSIDLGAGLPDGEYTWELVAMPSISPAMAEEMAAAANDPALRDDLSFDLPKRRAESGFFRVLGGAIVQPAAEPGVRGGAGGDDGPTSASDKQVVGVSEADQVILDDLIVDGSACIGQDCVNGESFGFDTLRLKENNLRIKAQDTSTSASFPSRDWQITFNDSSNGGQNKFSIDDIDGGRTPFTIEAGAPSHSLYVDDGGRLGFGTSSPVVELHVKDGDSPTLRLEQDGSSGFTPQTWDVAGNEANFFVRDVTNGSKLSFRIAPNSPDASIFIKPQGVAVGGTHTPTGQLHVRSTTNDNVMVVDGTGTVLADIVSTNNGAVQVRMQSDSMNRRFLARDGSGNTESQLVFGDNGDFDFLGPTATDVRMAIDSTGDVTIQGGLVTTGGGGACTVADPCDGVFHPDFEVPSIEDHAGFMWENSYLPAVGPTPADGPINITRKVGGILNELEKAHIYIEQLHDGLKAKDAEIESLQQRLARVEELLAAGQD